MAGAKREAACSEAGEKALGRAAGAQMAGCPLGTGYLPEVRDGFAIEVVSLTLSAESVARLGVARKIEFKVCGDEMAASYEFIQAAHELACKVAQ